MSNEEIAAMITSMNSTVVEIKKYILGNGQPGLLTRMTTQEIMLKNHCEDYAIKVAEMEKRVAERKEAEYEAKTKAESESKALKTRRDGEYWDIKKIIITVLISGTIGVGLNFVILEQLLRPLLSHIK